MSTGLCLATPRGLAQGRTSLPAWWTADRWMCGLRSVCVSVLVSLPGRCAPETLGDLTRSEGRLSSEGGWPLL